MKNKLFKCTNALKKRYFTAIIIFCLVLLNGNVVYAAGFDTGAFTGIIDMIDSVLKVCGVAIGLIGIARFAISFAQDNPESRYSSLMQIAAGVLLFGAKAILETMGLTI